MKAFISIELEINFTDEETKELDAGLKKHNQTFSYHTVEIFTELFERADITKESIKEIKVNRVD